MASGENETHLVFNLEGALPAKMGQKSLNVGGTKDEEERLSSFLTGYQALLSKERQTSKRNVSVAEYCSQESGKLLLKVKKGGHWNYYGHTEKSQTYLYPEEALYLQECGVMEIVSTGGGPWTIQKVGLSDKRVSECCPLFIAKTTITYLTKQPHLTQLNIPTTLNHTKVSSESTGLCPCATKCTCT